jgi:hypothetical protein
MILRKRTDMHMPSVVKGVEIPLGLQNYETYPQKVKLWVEATLKERQRIIDLLDKHLGTVDFDDLIKIIEGDNDKD